MFVALTQVQRGVLFARHLDTPGSSFLLQYVALICLMGYWLDRDSHEKQVGRVWDMGFFLCIAWPAIIPYHLIKTRGIKRASLIVFLFAVTCFAVFGITAAVCRAGQ